MPTGGRLRLWNLTAPRQIAFRTLLDVDRGGYAADLLYLATRDIDSRDAGLAEEIVFGVLRFQSQVDFLIRHYSGRGIEKLDPEVRIALRMGIYQLRYLERIPAHAAVSESVQLVRRARKVSAAGFVNAVLRKVDRQPVAWPGRAVKWSHPAWMLERWERQYGEQASEAIAAANLRKPETYIRVPPGEPAPEGAEPCTEVPGCWLLATRRSKAPIRFRTQDISSQAIVPLLDLRPGQTYLDLCAAPGNKTAQALESGVRAIACDIHHHRLQALAVLPAGLVVLDATAPLPFARSFDRILLDAPCSGTGTLARNPEIKWRLQAHDIETLHRRQGELLARALQVLAPGGRLVYSTCSLEREENEDVVAAYPVIRTLQRIPGRDRGDGFFAAVIEST
jgi:16S rRNA (cytosine967-C5)-methyltransferase